MKKMNFAKGICGALLGVTLALPAVTHGNTNNWENTLLKEDQTKPIIYEPGFDFGESTVFLNTSFNYLLPANFSLTPTLQGVETDDGRLQYTFGDRDFQFNGRNFIESVRNIGENLTKEYIEDFGREVIGGEVEQGLESLVDSAVPSGELVLDDMLDRFGPIYESSPLNGGTNSWSQTIQDLRNSDPGEFNFEELPISLAGKDLGKNFNSDYFEGLGKDILYKLEVSPTGTKLGDIVDLADLIHDYSRIEKGENSLWWKMDAIAHADIEQQLLNSIQFNGVNGKVLDYVREINLRGVIDVGVSMGAGVELREDGTLGELIEKHNFSSHLENLPGDWQEDISNVELPSLDIGAYTRWGISSEMTTEKLDYFDYDGLLVGIKHTDSKKERDAENYYANASVIPMDLEISACYLKEDIEEKRELCQDELSVGKEFHFENASATLIGGVTMVDTTFERKVQRSGQTYVLNLDGFKKVRPEDERIEKSDREITENYSGSISLGKEGPFFLHGGFNNRDLWAGASFVSQRLNCYLSDNFSEVLLTLKGNENNPSKEHYFKKTSLKASPFADDLDPLYAERYNRSLEGLFARATENDGELKAMLLYGLGDSYLGAGVVSDDDGKGPCVDLKYKNLGAKLSWIDVKDNDFHNPDLNTSNKGGSHGKKVDLGLRYSLHGALLGAGISTEGFESDDEFSFNLVYFKTF